MKEIFNFSIPVKNIYPGFREFLSLFIILRMNMIKFTKNL